MFEDRPLLSPRLAKKRRVQVITRSKLNKLLNLSKFKNQDNLLNSLLCFISVSLNHQLNNQWNHPAGVNSSLINKQQQDQMNKQWKLCPRQEQSRYKKSVTPHHLPIKILKCPSKAWWEALIVQIVGTQILQTLFKRVWCAWPITKNHQGSAFWWLTGHHLNDPKFSKNNCRPSSNRRLCLQLSKNQPLNNRKPSLKYLIQTAAWAVLVEWFRIE